MNVERGVLKSYDSGANTASVAMPNSNGVYLNSVPVNLAIENADMVAGSAVALAFFDDSNPADCCVIAVWVA